MWAGACFELSSAHYRPLSEIRSRNNPDCHVNEPAKSAILDLIPYSPFIVSYDAPLIFFVSIKVVM